MAELVQLVSAEKNLFLEADLMVEMAVGVVTSY